MAGKCVGENITFQQLNHVNIEDRGGLWEVSENIFRFVERYFRIAPEKDVVKIDSKSVVSSLVANTTVVHHAKALKSTSD